jgi:hypothetical protein
MEVLLKVTLVTELQWDKGIMLTSQAKSPHPWGLLKNALRSTKVRQTNVKNPG